MSGIRGCACHELGISSKNTEIGGPSRGKGEDRMRDEGRCRERSFNYFQRQWIKQRLYFDVEAWRVAYAAPC